MSLAALVTAAIFSDQPSSDAKGLTQIIIARGCNLNTYTLHFLVLILLLVFVELGLRRKVVLSPDYRA